MKRINRKSILAVLVVSIVLGLAGLVMSSSRAYAAQPTVNLQSSASFAILSGTPNITDAGNISVISGNVGLSPAAAAGIGLLCSQVTGTIYAVDGTGNPCFTVNGPLLVTAKNDLTTAFNDAAGRTPVTTINTELGGQTLTAGVYDSDSTTFQITGGSDGPGPLVLDGQGDSSSVFIFEMNAQGTGLTVGSGSTVSLINSASACNVFWRVDTAAINTTAVFKGTILALNSITVANGANIEGRLLARNGNVTLINDTITASTCATAASSGGSVLGASTSGVPGLPNTGIGPNSHTHVSLSIVIPAVAIVTLSTLYLVRAKRAI